MDLPDDDNDCDLKRVADLLLRVQLRLKEQEEQEEACSSTLPERSDM
jgi:hypothetical protein